ncbi:hypothetical protein B0H13DRAFT_2321706 [Mycena leptocephala]|nr:hypothetical protein B0H13DRAFT_2321706 [Mycena leptocephala]
MVGYAAVLPVVCSLPHAGCLVPALITFEIWPHGGPVRATFDGALAPGIQQLLFGLLDGSDSYGKPIRTPLPHDSEFATLGALNAQLSTKFKCTLLLIQKILTKDAG